MIAPQLADFGITEESVAEADAYLARVKKWEGWIPKGLACFLGSLLVGYVIFIAIREGGARALVVGLSCAIFLFVPWLYGGLLIRVLFAFFLDCFSAPYARAAYIRRRYKDFERQCEKYELYLNRQHRDS